MLQQQGTELEMFRFFEMTPDLVCIADKAGYFRNINLAVVQKLGYTREELFSRPIASFIHPADREKTSLRRTELLNGKALMNFDNRYLSKNGNIVWLHWTSIYFPEKELVFAIAKDITERKQKELETEEKYKKFESLATHFKSRLEKDKKHLATELHEEIAQLTSVVKMNVVWLRDHTPATDKAGQNKIADSLAVLNLLVESIQRLSFATSPSMLNDIGLMETLECLCTEFSRLSGLPCSFESSINGKILSQEIQLDLFRICQESLSNVMCHAQASAVKVTVACVDERICLTVTDNGKGFQTAQINGSAGFDNMRKRAASVNGHLTIQSEPGKGTSIGISV